MTKILSYKIVLHSELNPLVFNSICSFKDKEWSYGIESQSQWMNSHLEANDYHFLILQNNTIVAYCNVIKRNVAINGTQIPFIGLGNVLVDSAYRNQGIGTFLINRVTKVFFGDKEIGFLFCKPKLVSFYAKFRWHQINNKTILVNHSVSCNCLMMYGDLNKVKDKHIEFDDYF